MVSGWLEGIVCACRSDSFSYFELRQYFFDLFISDLLISFTEKTYSKISPRRNEGLNFQYTVSISNTS